MRITIGIITLTILGAACGGSGSESSGPVAPPPAPVASVVVEPATVTLAIGGTQALTATPRDASGNVLSRTISWASSNTSVATVSAGGLVTAVAPGGPVAITATSDGKSGTALVTVLPPVTSVVITGAASVKVGDSYTYTATARIADGTIVVRPVSWSVADPTRATMTPAGVMMPLQAGVIVVRATIDGVPWEATAAAYDWQAFGSSTTLGLALSADNRITNKFGSSEYPDLVIGCASGRLIIFVSTSLFVTNSGNVAYSFDGGTILTQTWLESDDFRNLIYPSFTNQSALAFATLIAGARAFGFAFTEFNSTAKAMIFRVTGLSPRLTAMVPACNLTSPRISLGSVDAAAVRMLLDAAGRSAAPSAEAALRRESGARASAWPALRVAPEPPASLNTKRGS